MSGEYTGCNHVRFLMTKFLYAVIILQQRHRRIRRCSYYLWAGCFVKRSRHRFILQSVPHTWKKHYCAKVYTISVLYSLDNGIVDLTITFISMYKDKCKNLLLQNGWLTPLFIYLEMNVICFICKINKHTKDVNQWFYVWIINVLVFRDNPEIPLYSLP